MTIIIVIPASYLKVALTHQEMSFDFTEVWFYKLFGIANASFKFPSFLFGMWSGRPWGGAKG